MSLRVSIPGAEFGLLGAHVLDRADDRAVLRAQCPLGVPLFDRLGHAKVDDLDDGLAVVDGHQDVRRLDVAMNDSVLVGVLYSLANGDKELQSLLGRELISVAIFGDRRAQHELHDEEGSAGAGRSNIENSCDVLVIHQYQGLPLGLESGHRLLGIHAGLDDLECNPAPHRLLLPGEVDPAHSPLADLLEQPVRADAGACAIANRIRGRFAGARLPLRASVKRTGKAQRIDCAVVGRIRFAWRRQQYVRAGGRADHGLIEEAIGMIAGPQQRLDTTAQLRIGRAFTVEKRGAIGGIRKLNCCQEHVLHALRVERHEGAPLVGVSSICAVWCESCRKLSGRFAAGFGVTSQPPKAS